MKIGVLALQGSFAEHIEKLREIKIETIEVRSIEDAKKINALIIPGGESTTLIKLLKSTGLDKWIIETGKSGLPIYGTCAGMIVLSKDYLNLIDIEVDRNAYGPQTESFEAQIDWIQAPNLKLQAIFIRAPRIKRMKEGVKTLASHNSEPVLVQQRNILVGSFHPELSEGHEIYEYFKGLTEK